MYFRHWVGPTSWDASMLSVGTAERQRVVGLPAAEDEDVAARCAARLLITASTQRGVEAVARRVHEAGSRAHLPFVHASAGDLPVDPQALRECCLGVLHAASGGSLLISAVEKMPRAVQAALIEVLVELESAGRPAAPVRLITGTTVSLYDRVNQGTFSERLFYRLNVIHLMQADALAEVAPS